ncbi:MAG: protein kinase [Acidiferrobacterales bacterium]
MNRLVIDVGVASRNGTRLDTGSSAVMERLSAEETAYYGALLAVAEVVGDPGDDEPEKAVLAGFKNTFLDVPEYWSIEEVLKTAFATANKSVRSNVYNRHAVTLSSLVLLGGHLFIGHAGDNRVWLYRDGRLQQLTSDHTQPRINQDPLLTRACGMESDIEMDFRCSDIREGDVLLITNNQAHECLDGSILISALVDEINASRMAETLVKAAVKNGIRSRASIIVARVDRVANDNKNVGIGRRYPSIRSLPAAGESVDGFEIQKRRRKGRLSHYYSAIDLLDDSPVLLKFPDPEYMVEEDLLASFARDEWLSRQISHPVLAKAINITRGRRSALYSALESVSGENLAQRVKRKGRLEVGEVRMIAGQLLGFLEHIHQQHIMHRDIRPENIILNRTDKTIHLLGFDSYRVQYWLKQPPKKALKVLSARYLAPESFRHVGSEIRADVFAAGVTLYFLLSGKFPYGNVKSPDDIQASKFRSITKYNDDLPESVADAIDSACAFEPDQRFIGATEFINAMS